MRSVVRDILITECLMFLKKRIVQNMYLQHMTI